MYLRINIYREINQYTELNTKITEQRKTSLGFLKMYKRII